MPNLPRAWGPTPGHPQGAANQGITTFKPPKITKKRRVPGAPGGAPGGVAPEPVDPVMSVFRSTLAQMRSLQTPVDEAAIRAPYQATGVTTQNLGDAWARQAQATGDTASQTYQGVRDHARTEGQRYAISAGAGAQPEPTSDPNASAIVNLTQAEVGAAHGAAAAWRDMLERAGGAAVSAAQIHNREQNSQNEQSLAATLPGAYQAADSLAFQRKAAADNTDYLNATLTEKQRARMQADRTTRRGQDVSRQNNQNTVSGADARLTRQIAAGEKHDATTQAGLNKRAQQVASTTKNSAGLTQILAALKPTAGKAGSEARGWDVQVQTIDPATGQGYGTPTTQHFADKRYNVPGGPDSTKWAIVGTPVPHKEKTAAVSQGITLASWKKAVGIAMTTRGLDRKAAEAFVQHLTPRPPK